jgi:hypothetical protein
MRSMFSVVSVLFVGLIGCKAGDSQMANRSALASNIGTDDPNQICPDICAPGTLCEMPDGRCMEACNACYCTREGGTVVEACPKEDVAPSQFQATGLELVAAGDADRAR